MTRYVTIKKAVELTGYTDTAIRQKIDNDVWKEGEVWLRAPDNRILIDMEGYELWAETGRASEQLRKHPLKSLSPLRESSAGKGSGSGPRPLT